MKLVTTRIDKRFADLKREGRAALVTFVTAGDPDYATSLEIIKGLPKAGADIIEFGMPFTDPMADGPAIQEAGLRALKAGQTLTKTLAMVREFRTGDDATPIVLMGYYNPIYIYGVERFLTDAKAAGVDGLIIVDLPPEEDDELCLPAIKAGLNFIRLATPTTDDKRAPAVLKNTSGFVYYVSVLGITGTKTPDLESVESKCHAPQGPYRAADRGRLRREDGRAGAQHRQERRRRGRRLGARQCGQEHAQRLRQADARNREGRARPGQRDRPGRAEVMQMNWIKNFVRPKIRGLLGAKRETPENMWVKCPETGQMVFYRDLENNQFVIPGSGYHMRMAPDVRLKSMFDGGAYETIALPQVPLDPLKFRDERRYTRPPQGSQAEDGRGGCDPRRLGNARWRAHRHGGAGFFLHGRLARHGGGRSVSSPRCGPRCEKQTPYVLFASSGGARMQEGILSLMQLPRTTIAVRSCANRSCLISSC